MKWLLSKIGLPKGIGLYVGEDTITLSLIAATPLGVVEIEQQNESIGDDEPSQVIQRMLAPLVGKRKVRRLPVSVGLPAGCVYFSTRPIHASTGDSSPHVLLREALRAPSAPVNEMMVDVIKTEPDARQVASIAACDRTYVSDILDALAALGVQPCRVEPAPCALLRLASSGHPARRGDKVVLRLFLSETQVLAVLVVDRMPLLWRFTQLSQGEEAAAIVAAYRSLEATTKDCGVDSSADAVMIHGRMELKRLVDLDWIEEQLDSPVTWFEGPSLGRSEIAAGVSRGSLDRDASGFDLARALKPRPSLMHFFPWRVALIEAALVGLMALLLGYRYWDLQEARQGLQVRAAASRTDTNATKRELQNRKKKLREQVQAIHNFLATRILWTSCLSDLGPSIPDNAYLMSVRAQRPLKIELKGRSRSKNKDMFMLRGAVAVPASGLVPREVDRLLDALRSVPSLSRDFPLITLDELKQSRAPLGDEAIAVFTVVCLPGEKKQAQTKKPMSKATSAPGKQGK